MNDHKIISYGQINEVFERKIFNISYPSFSLFAQKDRTICTGARIYENLLPCLMHRGLLFNSIQTFRENSSQ